MGRRRGRRKGGKIEARDAGGFRTPGLCIISTYILLPVLSRISPAHVVAPQRASHLTRPGPGSLGSPVAWLDLLGYGRWEADRLARFNSSGTGCTFWVTPSLPLLTVTMRWDDVWLVYALTQAAGCWPAHCRARPWSAHHPIDRRLSPAPLPIPAVPRGISWAVWNDGFPFSAAPCRPLGTSVRGGDPIRHKEVKSTPASGHAATVVERRVERVSQPIDDIVALVPIFHISVSHAPSLCP